MRLADPAVDLAVALALAGAARDHVLPRDTVVVGEVGLGGEVRRASRLDARLAEAAALGQVAAVVPEGGRGRSRAGLRLHRVSTLAAALALLGPG